MIKIQGKLDRSIYVACSGGVDSMAVVDFLKNNHEVTLCYFNHGTEHGDKAFEFVEQYASQNELGLLYGKTNREKDPKESKEEYWRNQRYDFFKSLNAEIITAHHLDDCIETWIWSSMHGNPNIIPYRNGNVIRPFRLNKKKDLRLWAYVNNVPHIEDDSNLDTCYIRNYIRHNFMPHVEIVNPGIGKVIRKKVLKYGTDEKSTNVS
jgi:tRNA(Ile)-lysidine synthase